MNPPPPTNLLFSSPDKVQTHIGEDKTHCVVCMSQSKLTHETEDKCKIYTGVQVKKFSLQMKLPLVQVPQGSLECVEGLVVCWVHRKCIPFLDGTWEERLTVGRDVGMRCHKS